MKKSWALLLLILTSNIQAVDDMLMSTGLLSADAASRGLPVAVGINSYIGIGTSTTTGMSIAFFTHPAIVLTLPTATLIAISSVLVRKNYYKRAANFVKRQEDIVEYSCMIKIRSKKDDYKTVITHVLKDNDYEILLQSIDDIVHARSEYDLITLSPSITLQDDTYFVLKTIKHKVMPGKLFDLQLKIAKECTDCFKVSGIFSSRTKLGIAASINSMLSFVTPLTIPLALVSWICLLF